MPGLKNRLVQGSYLVVIVGSLGVVMASGESAMLVVERELYRSTREQPFVFSAAVLHDATLGAIACPTRPAGTRASERIESTSCTFIRAWEGRKPEATGAELPGAVAVDLLTLMPFADQRVGVLFVQRSWPEKAHVDAVGLLWDIDEPYSFLRISDPLAVLPHNLSGVVLGVAQAYIVWSDFREDHFSPNTLRVERWAKVFGRAARAGGELGTVEQLCKEGRANCHLMVLGSIDGQRNVVMLAREGRTGDRIELVTPGEMRMRTRSLARGLELHSLCGFLQGGGEDLNAAWIREGANGKRELEWAIYDKDRRKRDATTVAEASSCSSLMRLRGHGTLLVYQTNKEKGLSRNPAEDLMAMVRGPEVAPITVQLMTRTRVRAFDVFPRENGSVELLTVEERGDDLLLMHRTFLLPNMAVGS